MLCNQYIEDYLSTIKLFSKLKTLMLCVVTSNINLNLAKLNKLVLNRISTEKLVFISQNINRRNIPGIDIPFRSYNSNHLPNWQVIETGKNI